MASGRYVIRHGAWHDLYLRKDGKRWTTVGTRCQLEQARQHTRAHIALLRDSKLLGAAERDALVRRLEQALARSKFPDSVIGELYCGDLAACTAVMGKLVEECTSIPVEELP